VTNLFETIFEIKEKGKIDNDHGVFEITPLSQGFGHTLGNALRRVLLTSLTGASATSVKISGIKHRFSTLKGMKEDVVELCLNIKNIAFIYDGDKAQKVKLSVSGPGEIKAKDLDVPAAIKVANPDLVLANLNKGAKLSAELTVEVGVGYSPFEERDEEKALGVIPLDASFSPVRRVKYEVEETRVGDKTNFDKLTIEIWTDNTVNPKDTLLEAAKILRDYFDQIVNPKKVAKESEVKEEDSLGPAGKLSVEEIGLPTRVANALIKAGVQTVEDLVHADKQELMKVRNLGEKSLKIIAVALSEKGVDFE